MPTVHYMLIQVSMIVANTLYKCYNTEQVVGMKTATTHISVTMLGDVRVAYGKVEKCTHTQPYDDIMQIGILVF